LIKTASRNIEKPPLLLQRAQIKRGCEKAKIQSSDKLAVITREKDGEVFCISLIKVEKLAEIVKGMLGPVIKDIIEK
jgi:hypothetical protein